MRLDQFIHRLDAVNQIADRIALPELSHRAFVHRPLLAHHEVDW